MSKVRNYFLTATGWRPVAPQVTTTTDPHS